MKASSARVVLSAVVLSIVLHGLMLLGPAWPLSAGQVSVLPPLDARLQPLPAPPVSEDTLKRPAAQATEKRPQKPVPRPRPHLKSPPRLPAEAPDEAGRAALPTEVSTEVPAEVPAAAPAETPPPPETPAPAFGAAWVTSGHIEYNVIRGERNFIIGRTEHRWTHDRDSYTMETVIETVGLVGLIKPFRMVQRSSGRITPQGLRPDEFSVERDGQIREKARFDWAAGRVELVAPDRQREVPLTAGDQDVLSLMHHLALLPSHDADVELLVVTGKSAVRSTIRFIALEDLDLPAGRVSAYHLGSSGHGGELKIDIWLARDYAKLPLRLKITDKDGDVLDQVATGVELGAPATPAPAPQ